jgi:hypothetical protein
VVFDGILADTALSALCRFWRVIVNFIRASVRKSEPVGTESFYLFYLGI